MIWNLPTKNQIFEIFIPYLIKSNLIIPKYGHKTVFNDLSNEHINTDHIKLLRLFKNYISF